MSKRVWLHVSWLAVAMLCVLGCQTERRTADLLVALRTDYVPGSEFTRIEVHVSGAAKPVFSDVCRDGRCSSFTQARLIATFEALPTATGRRVDVSLLDAAGKVIAKDSGVLDHGARTAMVLWVTRTCEDVACGGAQRCLGGQCVDARCTDGSQSECSPAQTCQGDDECDALKCGTARCELGLCTADVSTAECPAGEQCVPEIGCVGGLPEGDAGVPDGGVEPADDGGAPPDGPKNRFPDLEPAGLTYVSLLNIQYNATVWVGNEVALVTTTDALDPELMGRILTVYDDVYAYLERVTGRTPTRLQAVAGRAVIAFLPDTCSQGFCVSFGQTGVELTLADFDALYAGAAVDRFDVAPLEKVALNFWFYERQIGFPNSDVNAFGFAICLALDALRSVSPDVMERAGRDLSEYQPILEQFVDTYVELGAPWSTTVGMGTAPSNDAQLGGGSLVCSMLRRVAKRHGGDYFVNFFKQVGSLPTSANTLESVSDGLLIAASRAARADLSSVFGTRWNFPVTTAAEDLAQAAGPSVDSEDY